MNFKWLGRKKVVSETVIAEAWRERTEKSCVSAVKILV